MYLQGLNFFYVGFIKNRDNSLLTFILVKRPCGRPRRYPRPQENVTSSQIPAMIIPGVDGQTIMMAPIQVR